MRCEHAICMHGGVGSFPCVPCWGVAWPRCVAVALECVSVFLGHHDGLTGSRRVRHLAGRLFLCLYQFTCMCVTTAGMVVTGTGNAVIRVWAPDEVRSLTLLRGSTR